MLSMTPRSRKKQEAAAAEPAAADPAPPQAYNVSGAGNPKANGLYHLDTTQGDSNVYRGSGENAGLWLYLLRDQWVIARADEDWYTANGGGAAARPPATGWQVDEEYGVAPAPMVYPVAVSSSTL